MEPGPGARGSLFFCNGHFSSKKMTQKESQKDNSSCFFVIFGMYIHIEIRAISSHFQDSIGWSVADESVSKIFRLQCQPLAQCLLMTLRHQRYNFGSISRRDICIFMITIKNDLQLDYKSQFFKLTLKRFIFAGINFRGFREFHGHEHF